MAQDEAPPSTTDWAATNPNYNARTRLPSNLTPTLPSTVVYQPATTPTPTPTPAEKYWNWAGTLQYDNTPYGSSIRKNFVRDGLVYQWNPSSKRYEVTSVQPQKTSATTAGTNGNMSGVNTDFSKITNADQSQRQEFRTNYMMGLGPLQEGIRQARVGGTQSSDLLRSQLAQTAIGGFGGISGGADQQVLDAYRGTEGQYIEKKANLYTDYISNLLGVDKQTADAIAKEAVKRASKLAGAEKAYLQSEAEKLIGIYKNLGGN